VPWRVQSTYDPLMAVVGDRAIPMQFEMVDTRDDRRPEVTLGFEIRDGVPECTRVELRATAKGREVRSSDLRAVRVEDALETAISVAPHEYNVDADGRPSISPVPGNKEQARTTVKWARAARKEARRRVTDDMLREVARVYRENPYSPTSAVADTFDRAHRTAALYVHQARERGFLGPTSQGKAGEH